MRLSLSPESRRGFLQILEVGGKDAEVGLRPDDLKALAKALLKVAQALDLQETADEITEH